MKIARRQGLVDAPPTHVSFRRPANSVGSLRRARYTDDNQSLATITIGLGKSSNVKSCNWRIEPIPQGMSKTFATFDAVSNQGCLECFCAPRIVICLFDTDM